MIYRNEVDGTFEHFAWPGGYPVFHLCADGDILCPTCANTEPTLEAHGGLAATETDAPWRIVASDVNWEDPELYCDHCSKRVENAYAEN